MTHSRGLQRTGAGSYCPLSVQGQARCLLDGGTPEVYAEYYGTRDTEMKSLLRLFIFYWSPKLIPAADPAGPWGGC